MRYVKNYGFLVVILLSAFSTYSQNDSKKSNGPYRHELRLNGFNLIVFKAPSISYEYLASENLSYGISLLYNFDKQNPRESYLLPEVVNRTYSATFYVRRYFSKKYARGFFIEGFGMLASNDVSKRIVVTDEISDTLGENRSVDVVESQSHFAIGITFGGKFLMGKKGFIFEFFHGIGAPGVIGQSPIGMGAISRGGISFGFRF